MSAEQISKLPDEWINKILIGDALAKLRELPEGCVHTCVTSPPYWGLRDYGVEGQIGLEDTPEKFVEKLVLIFREVRRVLRNDGTLWLNLGDSYAGSWGNQGRKEERGTQRAINAPMIQNLEPYPDKKTKTGSWVNDHPTLKAKDLIGIPWMVAFALRADGWWLRSDIIWAKRNCMPESVKDRPTKAHEYIFLLAKSDSYFYDYDAIRESVEIRKDEPATEGTAAGKNKRTVWSIAIDPFPEAHFATFPQELVLPCVLAGTSEKGCCAKCGAPWQRILERPRPPRDGSEAIPSERDGGLTMQEGIERTGMSHFKYNEWLKEHPPVTTGWQKTCECSEEAVVPGVVLDPFMGAGTTALVALREKRNFLGIELNPEYADIAERRIAPERVQMKLF